MVGCSVESRQEEERELGKAGWVLSLPSYSRNICGCETFSNFLRVARTINGRVGISAQV